VKPAAASISHTIEISLAPIESHMHADGQPQITASTQQKAGEESKDTGIE